MSESSGGGMGGGGFVLTFAEVTGEKLVGGLFTPPAWIGIQLSVKRKNFGQFKKLWRKKITFRKIFSSM